MPPANIVDWLTATFTGSSVWGVYWVGRVKLHSEYVGAAVLALVALGVVRPPNKKLALFLAGIGLLFLLVAFGHTPFYRLWYAVHAPDEASPRRGDGVLPGRPADLRLAASEPPGSSAARARGGGS